MLLLAVGFVVLTAFDLARRWDGSRVQVMLPFAVVALLPMLLGNLLQAAAWIVLAERMAKKRIPRLAAASLVFDSQLARYTPGKVGLPLVRIEGAPRVGLSRGLAGVSVLIEAASWLATGALLGLLLLVFIEPPRDGLGALSGPWDLPLLGGALAGVLMLVAVDRGRAPKTWLARLSLEGRGPLAPAGLPALHLLYWGTWAAHGYGLALALGATHPGAVSIVMFVPLANVLGFLALAAPAGVGVREAALIYGLSPVLGGPGALAFAVLSRVQSLLADVIVWLVARALCRSAGGWPSDRKRADTRAPEYSPEERDLLRSSNEDP